jgi:dihydropteroate synthase
MLVEMNKKTLIMGILNVTPDSFYDKGDYFSPEKAIKQGIQLFHEGADILDIGGESTRPGAEDVEECEELRRTIPIIKALKKSISASLSIDTMKARVAAEAVASGADLINDVSGFSDPEMRHVAACSGAKICVMHMQGTPRTMQNNPAYPEGVITHILNWFENKVTTLIHAGVKENKIILDPGIGFGKTLENNIEILQNISRFKSLGFPVLLGTSRKSFLGKILNLPPTELLMATILTNTLALKDNVNILRVHDVLQHRNAIKLIEKLQEKKKLSTKT